MSSVYYVDADKAGRVLRSGTIEMRLDMPWPKDGTTRYLFPLDAANHPEHVYVEKAKLVPMPPRPSEHHVWDYASKAWHLDQTAAWRAVRSHRDDLLARTDWVVLRAQERGGVPPKVWMDYRQALRDITQQSDPLNIQWPEAPSA